MKIYDGMYWGFVRGLSRHQGQSRLVTGNGQLVGWVWSCAKPWAIMGSENNGPAASTAGWLGLCSANGRTISAFGFRLQIDLMS